MPHRIPREAGSRNERGRLLFHTPSPSPSRLPSLTLTFTFTLTLTLLPTILILLILTRTDLPKVLADCPFLSRDVAGRPKS
jgi:hypothetical protein